MVFERLRRILAEQLEIDEDRITMDTNIVDDLHADSLDVVEMIMSMEDEYGITIADDQIRGLATVRDVVEFVEDLVDA